MPQKKVHKIKFSIVGGECSQTIRLTKDCPYSPEELAQLLNQGKVWTSVHENTELLHEDGRVLGVVVESTVDGEYEGFELG